MPDKETNMVTKKQVRASKVFEKKPGSNLT